MYNQKVRDLVYLSMLMAIIIVLAFVPNIGLFRIGPISFTIVHIPVIIATIYLNRRIGVLTGAIFGISTLIVAYTQVMETPFTTDFLFRNPAISVAPRMVFPYVTALFYDNLRKHLKNDYLNVFITSIFGSFIHSILVLSTLFFEFMNVLYLEKAQYLVVNTERIMVPFFNTEIEINFITDALKFIGFVFLTSSIAEAIISGILATAVIFALRKLNQKLGDQEELLNQINKK
jgi:uncharacterized membrane protein